MPGLFQDSPRTVKMLSEVGQITPQWIDWFLLITQRLSFIRTGLGSPVGVEAAPVGTLFLRLDGGAGTTLYVKESGTGTAGWVAK